MNNTASDHNTRAVVDDFLSRFGAGDQAGMVELFAESVDFEVPGAVTVPWTGTRTSRPELELFVSAVLEAVKTEEFEIETRITAGQDELILGRFKHLVLGTGRHFSGPFALHVRVHDGKIVRYRMHEDSHAAAVAFAP